VVCRLSLGCDQGEHCPDCRRFDDRGESFTEVDPWPLVEAANNPSGLVPIKRAIGFPLMLENPFVGDDPSATWVILKYPGVVGEESIELELHSSVPVRVMERGPHRGLRLQRIFGVRLEDARLHPCHHVMSVRVFWWGWHMLSNTWGRTGRSDRGC
jgi:hypothetical protein